MSISSFNKFDVNYNNVSNKDLSRMKAWHIIVLSCNKTFTTFLLVFCIFLFLCLKYLSWSFMVCFWTLVQCSSISNYIRLIQSIACTISLLFWIVASIIGEKMFDHLHLMLIPPGRIGTDGGPFGGKTHPFGSSNKFTTKVRCFDAMLTKPSNKLITFIWSCSCGRSIKGLSFGK
jgi:hypothetical protein